MTSASRALLDFVSPGAHNARRWFSVALLAVSCCAGAAQAEPQLVTGGGADYSIGAVPEWVLRATVQEGPLGTSAAAPIRNLLLDYQISLLGSTPQLYIHQALAVQTVGAVEKAASIPITFSPDSQRLTVHALSVLRAGRHIDKLPTARVELLRRETGRESVPYDGVATAAFLLDDVRVEDIVEVEYTLSSEPLVAGELYNSTLPLATSEPVDTLRVRVLSTVRRPLRYSVLSADVTPRVTRHGDVSELTLERTSVPGMRVEASTPEDAIPWPRLRVSEYLIWGAAMRGSSCGARRKTS
jgi:hypothetical protein